MPKNIWTKNPEYFTTLYYFGFVAIEKIDWYDDRDSYTMKTYVELSLSTSTDFSISYS